MHQELLMNMMQHNLHKSGKLFKLSSVAFLTFILRKPEHWKCDAWLENRAHLRLFSPQCQDFFLKLHFYGNTTPTKSIFSLNVTRSVIRYSVTSPGIGQNAVTSFVKKKNLQRKGVEKALRDIMLLIDSDCAIVLLPFNHLTAFTVFILVSVTV